MSRILCQFSCGAASAVAAKLIIAERRPEDEVLVVNAFIKEEHPDNRRFLADCEQWLGYPITVLMNQKYQGSTDTVWLQRGYMKGPNGAPCSSELKRKLLRTIVQPADVMVLGFTSEEEDRLLDMQELFPEDIIRAPLVERGLSKDDCLAIVERAGLKLPAMYLLGYDNANCIGCPKGGQAYWQNIREDFPERFQEVYEIQKAIGPGANFLRFRSGPRKEERFDLSELPPGRGDMRSEPSFSCSFFCALAEREWQSE